jgi:hypothetical protein
MGQQMEEKCPETIPKSLPGVVCVQWVRCGRAGCRCQSGKLHGPYHYRFWRENGRLRKAYVPRAQLAQVRAACEARRRARRQLTEAWSQWRTLAAFIKEVERQ